jgi:chromosome segregation ATPase
MTEANQTENLIAAANDLIRQRDELQADLKMALNTIDTLTCTEPDCTNQRAPGVRICASHRDENLDLPDPLEPKDWRDKRIAALEEYALKWRRERDDLAKEVERLDKEKPWLTEANAQNANLRKTCKGLIRSCYKRARERNELRSEIDLMADVIAQRDALLRECVTTYDAWTVAENTRWHDGAMAERIAACDAWSNAVDRARDAIRELPVGGEGGE